MRPERHLTALQDFPARSRVLKEPYGVALIMLPWNYPFLLLISPLIGALAAGNCCVLKPSELAPATAKAITRMIEGAFPAELVCVVNGGIEESQALLALDFDHIFYTGSVGVGKSVYQGQGGGTPFHDRPAVWWRLRQRCHFANHHPQHAIRRHRRIGHGSLPRQKFVPDVHTQEDGRSTSHMARPVVALSALQRMEGQIHQEIFEVVSGRNHMGSWQISLRD